jgi:prepilin-type N-terminal cleavage/methylation domain-containing protein
MSAISTRRSHNGFTLIELLVAISILLIMGVIIISFLRGALDISRTGAARGEAYGTAQTVMRDISRDLAQVLPGPAHADGPMDDPAFVLVQDPLGRQMLAFTRAWGEEMRSVAGYDAGRGAPQQGYRRDFTGRNVRDAIRAGGGNIEVVYLMEPTPEGTRLLRAERAPPDPAGGLITRMLQWCHEYRGQGEMVPLAALRESRIGGEPLWDQFELVAENVVAFGVECWDDWDRTRTWHTGATGPVTEWSMFRRLEEGKFALPRALRLTLVIATREPLRAETELSSRLHESDMSLFVGNTTRFPDPRSGAAFLRVGGEVMEYTSRSGSGFGSVTRGALGTRPSPHTAGATVLSGEVFQRVIQLPVAR